MPRRMSLRGQSREFRVSVINMSGPGEPSAPSAMVPTVSSGHNSFLKENIKCTTLNILSFCLLSIHSFSVRPRFKGLVDFMVVRAGNSIRIKVDYEVL